MLPDRVSNPGPLTYESEALPTFIDMEMRQYMLLMYNSVKQRKVKREQYVYSSVN